MMGEVPAPETSLFQKPSRQWTTFLNNKLLGAWKKRVMLVTRVELLLIRQLRYIINKFTGGLSIVNSPTMVVNYILITAFIFVRSRIAK